MLLLGRWHHVRPGRCCLERQRQLELELWVLLLCMPMLLLCTPMICPPLLGRQLQAQCLFPCMLILPPPLLLRLLSSQPHHVSRHALAH